MVSLFWRVQTYPSPYFAYSRGIVREIKQFLLSPRGDLIDPFRIKGIDTYTILQEMMAKNINSMTVYMDLELPYGTYVLTVDRAALYSYYDCKKEEVKKQLRIWLGNSSVGLWARWELDEPPFGFRRTVIISGKPIDILVYGEKELSQSIMDVKEEILNVI